MTERVVLHVGAMKTGTSYVQNILAANRVTLRRHGVLVAPSRSAAVHDLVGFARGGESRLDAIRGSWDTTAARMRDFDGEVAVLSHEYLGDASAPVIRRAGESFAATDLHVVVTVRDTAATLPAQWQTFARNRGTMTWPEYAASARDPSKRPREHTFLRSQRIGRMLAAWGEVAGARRLHVVSVPVQPAEPDTLWGRFASVAGFDPALAPHREVAANTSTGYATAHLLCLLHQAAEEARLPRAEVRRMTMHVAQQAVRRRSVESRPPLDEATLEFAARWNQRIRDAVQEQGASFTGSLEDLPVEATPARAAVMAVPGDEELLEAAAAATAALATVVDEAPTTRPGSVPEAVRVLVDLMQEAVRGGGVSRLNARGRALS